MIAAITLAGTVACIVFACMVNGRMKRGLFGFVVLVLLVPSALALIVIKPELVDARIRTYKQLYGDIQVGMSRADVMTLVERHYPAEGRRLRPQVIENTEERLSFHMNPEGAKGPNCEGISVNLYEDKVVYKFYSRD